MFQLTKSPEEAFEKGLLISVIFEAGIPIKVLDKDNNKEYTDPLESFLYLNKVAGRNAIGRIDIVENRFVGIKSRGVYETPAGKLLHDAHIDLEGLCLDREVVRIKESLQLEFGRLCYNGFWFAPEMELIMHSMEFTQRNVTGAVELSLYKGNVTVLGRESPFSLYSADLASMDIEGGGSNFDYNPADAQGFIKINAVRLRAYNSLTKKFKELSGE